MELLMDKTNMVDKMLQVMELGTMDKVVLEEIMKQIQDSNLKCQIWVALGNRKQEKWRQLKIKKMKMKDGVMLELFLIDF
jgi:UDP-N-acetyl-D-mannosaminuronic acid transferase (WecB/TagA/CpsF family)